MASTSTSTVPVEQANNFFHNQLQVQQQQQQLLQEEEDDEEEEEEEEMEQIVAREPQGNTYSEDGGYESSQVVNGDGRFHGDDLMDDEDEDDDEEDDEEEEEEDYAPLQHAHLEHNGTEGAEQYEDGFENAVSQQVKTGGGDVYEFSEEDHGTGDQVTTSSLPFSSKIPNEVRWLSLFGQV